MISLYKLLFEDKEEDLKKNEEESEKEKEKTGIPEKLKSKSNLSSYQMNPTSLSSSFKQKLIGINLQGQEDNNYLLRPLVLNKSISKINDLKILEVNQNSSLKYNSMGILPFFIFDNDKILSIKTQKNEYFILLFYCTLPGALIDDDNSKMMNKIFKKKNIGEKEKDNLFDTEGENKELIIKVDNDTINYCPIKIDEIELIQNIFKSDNENSIISLFNNYKNSRVIKNVGSENVTKESYIVNPYQLKYLLKSLVNNLKIRFANHSKEVYKVSKNKL